MLFYLGSFISHVTGHISLVTWPVTLLYMWIFSGHVVLFTVKADEDLNKYALKCSRLGCMLWKHHFPQDMEDKAAIGISSEDEVDGMPLVDHQVRRAVRPTQQSLFHQGLLHQQQLDQQQLSLLVCPWMFLKVLCWMRLLLRSWPLLEWKGRWPRWSVGRSCQQVRQVLGTHQRFLIKFLPLVGRIPSVPSAICPSRHCIASGNTWMCTEGSSFPVGTVMRCWQWGVCWGITRRVVWVAPSTSVPSVTRSTPPDRAIISMRGPSMGQMLLQGTKCSYVLTAASSMASKSQCREHATTCSENPNRKGPFYCHVEGCQLKGPSIFPHQKSECSPHILPWVEGEKAVKAWTATWLVTCLVTCNFIMLSLWSHCDPMAWQSSHLGSRVAVLYMWFCGHIDIVHIHCSFSDVRWLVTYWSHSYISGVF